MSTGQVYSYVPKRWRLEPKGKREVSQTKETGKTADGKGVGTPPSSSGLIQTLEGGVLTKRSSRIASRKDGGEGETLLVVNLIIRFSFCNLFVHKSTNNK